MPDKQPGFTLLEILVAIAIMGMIMVLIQGTTSQMLGAKDRIEERDLLLQSGRTVLRKFSDDLLGTFLMRTVPVLSFAGTAIAPPVQRTVPRPVTFFIAKDTGEQDELKFTTLSHLRFYRNSHESDQVKVEYRLEPWPEERSLFSLIRTEQAWLDEKSDVEGKSVTLAEGVKGLNIEYYDPRKDEWVREWNTESIDWKDKLPQAVRVTVAFPDPDDRDAVVAFSTAILLPLAGAPIDF